MLYQTFTLGQSLVLTPLPLRKQAMLLRKEGRKEEHIFLVVSYYAHPFPISLFLFFHPDDTG